MENRSSPSYEASQGGSLRGRFSEATDEFVQVFTASIEFDRRLYREDIAGSIAHATMLETIGVLTLAEQEQIVSGLNTILREIEDGEMQWRVELEDVHMNIEHRLIELVGDTWQKAAYRTLPQRSGRHRHSALSANGHRPPGRTTK
jgi:argininosuccinate lyase